LKQVLLNIVRNAIQASPLGSVVSVDWQTDTNSVTIDVADRGTGIADDVLPHIFDPFFSTKSQIKEGMGLGLSVTRNLVESLRGSINVKTKVGLGTTFTIRLPRYLH